jgi:hypothetical protein
MILCDSVFLWLKIFNLRNISILLHTQNYGDSFEIFRRDEESEDRDQLNVIAFP